MNEVMPCFLLKILVLFAMSLIIFECADTPTAVCPPATIQKLKNATEEVRTKHLQHWEKQVSLEKAYLLASYQIIHPTNSRDVYRNWDLTSNFMKSFCKAQHLNNDLNIDSIEVDCSTVAEYITNCIRLLQNIKYSLSN
ncbi:hypothetical protein RF11_06090 [Thelohanellus kitauei]|uniref:Uncharacterized protein n=1 Tax=Thelohanellus kitauei TaxID=669202 RepID=A0A0C2M5L4_THEKT|nr:hypothetical protein RF11_06090 [Thelohanellus kitauei]